MTRKRLGVIGGMGPAASALFYRMVTERTAAACDQEHIDLLLWSHASMPDRTTLLLDERGEELYEKLLADARMLEQMGCTALAIPCNTSHVFAARLRGDLTVSFLDMIEAAAQEAARRGWRRAAICRGNSADRQYRCARRYGLRVCAQTLRRQRKAGSGQ